MKSPLLLLATLSLSSLQADTIFTATIEGLPRLLQEQGGNVTPVPTNLPFDAFASLSRDGRFITVVSPDPAQPNQTSQDLFLFDRATNQRRQVINNTSQNFPDGTIVSRFPRFSALSPDNSVIAVATNIVVTTNLQGSSTTPFLSVNLASDGFEIAIAEIGRGSELDLFRAEHVGISWLPGTGSFVTPSYVNTVTQTNQPALSVGLARFTRTPNGTYQKTRLTMPLVFDAISPVQIQTHIYPAVSPSGAKIAYFEVLWPNALLTQQATATLVTINADGSGRTPLVSFGRGSFPAGLTWSSNGTQLIFGVGPQPFRNGQFLPEVIPQDTVIRATSSSIPQAPTQVPGIDSGFLPFQSFVVAPPIDFASIPVNLATTPEGLLLTASGLPATQSFVLERATSLGNFGNPASFTGTQFGNGILLSRNTARQFFRIRMP